MSYVLGLDLGIASVGWSIVEPGKRIIDLGVRVFKKAETVERRLKDLRSACKDDPKMFLNI